MLVQSMTSALSFLLKLVLPLLIAHIKASPIAEAVQATENFKRKYILESMAWYLDFAQYGFDIAQAIRDLAKTLVEPIPDLDLPL